MTQPFLRPHADYVALATKAEETAELFHNDPVARAGMYRVACTWHRLANRVRDLEQGGDAALFETAPRIVI